MIVANLIGGLGNQLFQYACARASSLSNGQECKLFLADFGNYRLHNGFCLDTVFNMEIDIAEMESMRELVGWRANSLARKLLRHSALRLLRGKNFIVDQEDTLEFQLLKSLPAKGAYLVGYWQSEFYFAQYAEKIREDLEWRQPLKEKNSEIAGLILDTRSASIHVRRGDYLNNPKALAMHGVCSVDYYQRGIEALENDGRDRTWFLFSDDPAWAREKIAPLIHGDVHTVDFNKGEDSHFDMQLMSLCDDHIIANSSFSWWGAWLSVKLNKRVIAPKNWFAGREDTPARCPSSWQRL